MTPSADFTVLTDNTQLTTKKPTARKENERPAESGEPRAAAKVVAAAAFVLWGDEGRTDLGITEKKGASRDAQHYPRGQAVYQRGA